MDNPALQYANDVLSGKLPACVHVRNACKRFVSDLDKYEFHPELGARAVRFIQCLRHTKGKGFAGTLVHLEPWEVFIIYNVFGFSSNGKRRFKRSYVEVPRKNGKTFLAAAVAAYAFIADGEPGAEVYTAATKLDQAAIAFEQAYFMIEGFNSEYGFDMVMNNSFNNRRVLYEGSIFKPLSKEHKTLDGLNPHCAIVDEYHAHPSDELYNVIMNGMGAREQPLLFTITTAGFDRLSACYAHREYCTRVLDGSVEDENLFAIIYTMDDDDDWTHESTWIKANPNYGVSVKPEFLAQQVKEAMESPTKEVEFKTKLLNVWTDAAEVWIPDATWMKCAGDVEPVGACWGGLDLAKVSDFCAFTLAWPHGAGYRVLTRYYIPEEKVMQRNDHMARQLRAWVRDGLIIATPGNVTDYAFIKQDVLNLCAEYEVKSIAYDRYNSSQLVIELQNEGIEMNGFGQGYVSMNTPTKELERLVLEGNFWHGGNPVSRWQVGNVALRRDPADNVKIDKEKSKDKVDGIVSMVMAIGEAMEARREPEQHWVESFKL